MEGVCNEPSEEIVYVSAADVLSEAFEGDDPSDGVGNEVEMRQRRRTFHIV